LLGEPGTGKTLLAETFAQHLKQVEGEDFQFLRFNMQQYTDERSIASLFGSGQFYIDSSMGELTTPVHCIPKTVILFDEIEKAHPSIIQSLLAVLDRGRSQDSTSLKWIDFSQTFILFTTNLGSEQLSQRRENGQVLGTLDNASLASLLSQQKGERTNGLSPELINRLCKGRFLVFESLSPENLLQIYMASWNRSSNAMDNTIVDTVACTSELATLNLLKRLPDLSARSAASAAQSDMVACMEPVFEAYESSGLAKDSLFAEIRLKGLEKNLDEYLVARDLDRPQTVLIVDDDSTTEQVVVLACANAKLAIDTQRTTHDLCFNTVSKALQPEIILIDLFIEDNIAQQKSTQALSSIIELKNRFSDVPIIAFCRNPASSPRTKEVLQAAKFIDGVSAVLTYQAKSQQVFTDEIVRRLKLRRLATLAQSILRERKRLQFHWHAEACADHIELEAGMLRLEPIITPGEESKIAGLGEIPKLTFDDVIGNERGVRQISRAIAWLQHPGRIGRFGFRPPGGYLLAGPPGTGKTFLARAAAGECGLPFFSLNAADLRAPLVGESEAKLRKLFSDARRLAPSIIFIDEIDSIARQRGNEGSHLGLVNTLLGEMDGFAGHTRPVLVLAATNFPQSLDSALTRPGRFDETIMCDLPNREARQKLIRKGIERLELFLKDGDEEKLVLRTQGESAAAIEAAIRHAVYIADGEDRDPEPCDIVDAFEQQVYGTIREDFSLAKEEKWSTACHEAGHALAGHLLFPGRTVDYISIQPRTDSLGFVAYREDSTNAYGSLGMTRKEITQQIAVCLAGREAERIMLGEAGMSTGAGSDLSKANNSARRAVMIQGLDQEVGPLQVTPEILSTDPILAELCNKRVKAWLTQSEQEVRLLLEQNKKTLEALALKLNDAESMDKDEFLMLMEAQKQ